MSAAKLTANSDYKGCEVEIFHKPTENWFSLVETKNAIVMYKDKDGSVRRAKLESIGDVRFGKGEENTSPVLLDKGNNAPPVEKMVDGLMTNTSYEGSGLEVNHLDKGWLPLVRTANKVIFYRDGDTVRRMTPKKFGGVRNPAEEPAPFEETVDSFLFSEAA